MRKVSLPKTRFEPGFRLPPLLERIAEVAGTDVAYKLASEFGGLEISLNKFPRPNDFVTRLVGIEAARAIVKEIGHGKIEIPMADFRGRDRRRAAVARLLKEGYSTTKAALAVNVHVRTVFRVKERIRVFELREARKSSQVPSVADAALGSRGGRPRQGGGVPVTVRPGVEILHGGTTANQSSTASGDHER